MIALRLLAAAWASRWNALRLAVAACLLWTFAADTGARLARARLAALPGFDYAAEIDALRARGRYAEALTVADAGLNDPDARDRDAIRARRDAAAAEQASILRRLTDAGRGALTGRGDSLESLLGAVTADMLVVGDVRDLIVEGGKLALDGDADEVVLALSAVGVATTVAPEIDWAPSLLKAARRAGTLTEGMRDAIVRAAKGGRAEEIGAIAADAAALSKKAGPGGAIHLLGHADTPADLARAAAFVERRTDAAFALHVTGRDGVRLLARAGDAADPLIVKAARKGTPGGAFLRTPAARVLLKPHPIVGLLKGLRKGTIADAAARLLERFDPHAWWAVPLLAAWTLLECGFLLRRFGGVLAPARRGAGAGERGESVRRAA